MDEQEKPAFEGKLIALPTPTPEIVERTKEEIQADINKDLIELLEAALVLAREGKFVGGLMMFDHPDGAVSPRYTDTYEPMRRIGALECLKFDWMHALHAEADEVED